MICESESEKWGKAKYFAGIANAKKRQIRLENFQTQKFLKCGTHDLYTSQLIFWDGS
jgi:hypothetical protein